MSILKSKGKLGFEMERFLLAVKITIESLKIAISNFLGCRRDIGMPKMKTQPAVVKYSRQ